MEHSDNAHLRRIAATSLFLLLGVTITFCQENKPISNASSIDNGWWIPILKKHNIDLKTFNYKNIINIGMMDNSDNNLSLEMGNSDSLKNRNIPYKNAILISPGGGKTYWIITSEYARHDLDNYSLILRNGQMACYDFTSENVTPIDTSSLLEMSIDIKNNSIRASAK